VAIESRIRELAPDLFSADPSVSTAALTELGAMQAQLDATYSSTIQDAFGNEVPAFDPLTRTKAMEEFTRDASYYGALGWFNAAAQSGNGLAAYMQVYNGGGPAVDFIDPDTGETVSVGLISNLTAEDHNKLLGDMATTIRFLQKQSDRLDDLDDERAEDRNDAYKLAFITSTGDDRYTIYQAIKQDPLADPDVIAFMERQIRSEGTGQLSDPGLLRKLNIDILTGDADPNDVINALPFLSDDDGADLLRRSLELEDENHYTNWTTWDAGVQKLKIEAGVPFSPGSSGYDEEEARFQNALSGLYQWAEAQGDAITKEALEEQIQKSADALRQIRSSDTIGAVLENIDAGAGFATLQGLGFSRQTISDAIIEELGRDISDERMDRLNAIWEEMQEQ
jgi:hypothetical protein